LRDCDVVQLQYFWPTERMDANCLHCSLTSTSGYVANRR
jgi:hypothetical protein